MKTVKLIGVASVFFYVLCWFTDQPTKTIHYIGIAMPWLSLLLSIPIAYLCKARNDQYFSSWGYVYAISTVIYVVTVSVMSGSIYQQLPHMAACVCFIAYFALEGQAKRTTNN